MTSAPACSAFPPPAFLWGPYTSNFTETTGDTHQARVDFDSFPRAPPRNKHAEEVDIIYFRQDYRNVIWAPEGNHLVCDVDRWELLLIAEHRHAFRVRLIFSRRPQKGVLRLSILLLNAERKPIKVEGQSAYVVFRELRNDGSVSQCVLKDFCRHFDLDLGMMQLAIHTSFRHAESHGLLP